MLEEEMCAKLAGSCFSGRLMPRGFLTVPALLTHQSHVTVCTYNKLYDRIWTIM